MEWYVNTASFYRQIRNFKIDIRATDPNAYVCGIHYQVAQATSLQFVEIIANRATTQQGMCKLRTPTLTPCKGVLVLHSSPGLSAAKKHGRQN